MICRLCLQDSSKHLPIFEELAENNADIAAVIAQHFWFEPKIDDPISVFICCPCWKIVYEFHQFYERIREANREENLLIPCVAIKLEGEDNKHPNLPDADIEDPLMSNLFVEVKIKEDFDENDDLLFHPPAAAPEDFVNQSFTNDSINGDDSSSEDLDADDNLPLAKIGLIPEVENKVVKARRKRRSRKKFLQSRSSSGSSEDTKDEERGNHNDSNAPKKCLKNNRNMKERLQQMDATIAKHVKMICAICSIEEDNFLNLTKHMREIHSSEKGYVICCNRKYYSRPRLCAHVQKHIDPTSLCCKICNRSFCELKTLQSHLSTQHQIDDVKIYECKQCPQSFGKLHILLRHELMHQEQNFICEVCKKRFPNENLLEAHFNAIHNNGILCDICAKEIRGRKAFERHRLEHDGIHQPRWQCDICQLWYKDKYGLRKHRSRHNVEGIVHKCSICEKVYPNRIALLKHQRDVHTTPKFGCTVCSKAFKKSIHLKEHLATHTGQSLYSCPYCPKSFNASSSFHCHRKNMHPKEFEEERRLRIEALKPSEDQSTSVPVKLNLNSFEM